MCFLKGDQSPPARTRLSHSSFVGWRCGQTAHSMKGSRRAKSDNLFGTAFSVALARASTHSLYGELRALMSHWYAPNAGPC